MSCGLRFLIVLYLSCYSISYQNFISHTWVTLRCHSWLTLRSLLGYAVMVNGKLSHVPDVLRCSSLQLIAFYSTTDVLLTLGLMTQQTDFFSPSTFQLECRHDFCFTDIISWLKADYYHGLSCSKTYSPPARISHRLRLDLPRNPRKIIDTSKVLGI